MPHPGSVHRTLRFVPRFPRAARPPDLHGEGARRDPDLPRTPDAQQPTEGRRPRLPGSSLRISGTPRRSPGKHDPALAPHLQWARASLAAWTLRSGPTLLYQRRRCLRQREHKFVTPSTEQRPQHPGSAASTRARLPPATVQGGTLPALPLASNRPIPYKDEGETAHQKLLRGVWGRFPPESAAPDAYAWPRLLAPPPLGHAPLRGPSSLERLVRLTCLLRYPSISTAQAAPGDRDGHPEANCSTALAHSGVRPAPSAMGPGLREAESWSGRGQPAPPRDTADARCPHVWAQPDTTSSPVRLSTPSSASGGPASAPRHPVFKDTCRCCG